MPPFPPPNHTLLFPPRRFFVSWSGVLVLAYQGFSPSLEALKDHISREAGSLPKENPGSK